MYLQLPLLLWGLSLSVFKLEGKHCRNPHYCNEVVDIFGQCLLHPETEHWGPHLLQYKVCTGPILYGTSNKYVLAYNSFCQKAWWQKFQSSTTIPTNKKRLEISADALLCDCWNCFRRSKCLLHCLSGKLLYGSKRTKVRSSQLLNKSLKTWQWVNFICKSVLYKEQTHRYVEKTSMTNLLWMWCAMD